jgi:hypothetical protein
VSSDAATEDEEAKSYASECGYSCRMATSSHVAASTRPSRRRRRLDGRGGGGCNVNRRRGGGVATEPRRARFNGPVGSGRAGRVGFSALFATSSQLPRQAASLPVWRWRRRRASTAASPVQSLAVPCAEERNPHCRRRSRAPRRETEKVYTWFANGCAGGRKRLLEVYLSVCKRWKQFTMLPKKVYIRGYETAEKVYMVAKNVYMVAKKFTLKFT